MNDVKKIVSRPDPCAETGTPLKTICPEPGYCLKCSTVDGDKVFINVCISDAIPAPLDLTDEELEAIIEKCPEEYRVPLSLGEPHSDMDKSGSVCSAYDAVIHSKFYEKIEASEVFRAFFYYAVFQGLEQKYAVQIDNVKHARLQNKKYFGALQTQTIRTYSKPMILETADSLGKLNINADERSNQLEDVKMELITEQSPKAQQTGGGDAASTIAFLKLRIEVALPFIFAEMPSVSTKENAAAELDGLHIQISRDKICLFYEPTLQRWSTFHAWQILAFSTNQTDLSSAASYIRLLQENNDFKYSHSAVNRSAYGKSIDCVAMSSSDN